MFSDTELDILARVYARILAWPDEDEEEADCSAGEHPQSASSGDEESAIDILPDAASGEETITQTEP